MLPLLFALMLMVGDVYNVKIEVCTGGQLILPHVVKVEVVVKDANGLTIVDTTDVNDPNLWSFAEPNKPLIIPANLRPVIWDWLKYPQVNLKAYAAFAAEYVEKK